MRADMSCLGFALLAIILFFYKGGTIFLELLQFDEATDAILRSSLDLG